MTAPFDITEHEEHERDIPADVRIAVLERDNCQCQCCGTTGDNVLQLHHWLLLRSQGGPHTEYNLVTLCFRCHNAAHDFRIRIRLIRTADGRLRAFVQR